LFGKDIVTKERKLVANEKLFKEMEINWKTKLRKRS